MVDPGSLVPIFSSVDGVCVFFTLNRCFYPSTTSTTVEPSDNLEVAVVGGPGGPSIDDRLLCRIIDNRRWITPLHLTPTHDGTVVVVTLICGASGAVSRRTTVVVMHFCGASGAGNLRISGCGGFVAV